MNLNNYKIWLLVAATFFSIGIIFQNPEFTGFGVLPLIIAFFVYSRIVFKNKKK